MNDLILKIVMIATAAGGLFCTGVYGQPGAPDPQGPFADSLERRRAEMDLRSVPTRLRARVTRNFSDPQLVKQMNEDFVRIQAVRAEMVKVFADKGTLQPRQLRIAAREIRRRGARLRSLLALSDEHQDVDLPRNNRATIDSVNARAFQLCLEISRFIGNPMFKTKGVITIINSREASETLDMLIGLAEVLEKESDGMADQ